MVHLFFTTSILTIQLVELKDAKSSLNTSLSPPCPANHFACADGSACIPKSELCNGYGIWSGKRFCNDGSHNFPSQCDSCSADHLFRCQKNGVDVCVTKSWICDGYANCDDGSDEATSLCLPPCSADTFACLDGTRCISKSNLCNGYPSCEDNSNNFASQCDYCSAGHLFRCQRSGVDVCLNVLVKCDGQKHCDDYADELMTGCPNCVKDPSLFTCRSHGQNVCLRKNDFQCDGVLDCDDGSDEFPSACDNCSQPGIAMCRDGSRCVKNHHLCRGFANCADGSDESDTWSNCTHCTKKLSVPCPGFPGNCAKLCDGRATCPDAWDEVITTCKSTVYSGKGLDRPRRLGQIPNSKAHSNICDTNFQCKDGSRCLRKGQLCNSVKDCADGSDESAATCREKCQSKRAEGFPLISCDKDSCIRSRLACTAHTQPLCEDGKDMADSLCNGKCYTSFPEMEDPYRWPCANGTKRCILQTYRCDGEPDCDDATELNYASDEQNCPFVTKVGLPQTLLICLAIVVLSWLLFFMLVACNLDISFLAPSSLDPASSPPPSDQAPPSFLLHPALSDMDNKGWSWKEVGEQLRIEVVFFNRDPEVLFGFLYHIEAQVAHPDSVHNAFTGFFSYLETKGYNPIEVALSMRQNIGHHRLAHMALKGPPNFIDRILFQLDELLGSLEIRGKLYFFLICSLRALQTSVFPFLIMLDYVKDLILYLILRETVQRLERGCKQLSPFGIECLAASGTEQDILRALLVTFSISIILTSINSFFLRKQFFKASRWLNIFFAFISPLLPAIYHIQMSQRGFELDRQKTKLSNDDLKRTDNVRETLSNSIQQTKEIEVGLEAVMQILLLLGLVSFLPYVFNAPSGQSYSYFFGVALLVLKGNKVLFFASLFCSFLSPCMFYVNRTNVLRHGSLNVSRKLVLMARNVLFLLVRVLAFTSAIFIPVIIQWDAFVANQGVDASSKLDYPDFRIEFQSYFSKSLDALTADTRKNSHFFLMFLFVHLKLVASHAIFCSPKFGKSMMIERLMHLVSSFWLPLPFLTIRGVDRGEENAELWFMVVLHSLENFAIVLTSRLIYLQESYPLGIVIFDCVLVFLNLLGVLMSVFYVSKIELYAGLPREHTTLPSFTSEVS